MLSLLLAAPIPRASATFGAADFRQVSLNYAGIQLTPSLGDYLARLRLRAISTFERMTSQQITAGFAAFDADATAGTQPRPVVENSHPARPRHLTRDRIPAGLGTSTT